MKTKIFFVKSPQDYLKTVVSRILESPQSLKSGREFKNIKLRPREVLGAFLICAVVRHLSNQDWTIARDPEEGDGMIWCRHPGREDEVALLEQVYIRLRGRALDSRQLLNEVNSAVSKKIEKGREYARNRHLIIFLDATGYLDPQKIKKLIDGIEKRFDSYWLFARFSGNTNLDYVTFLLKAETDQPSAYKVTISPDYREWIVTKLGNL